MLTGWWGKILLVLMIGIFTLGLYFAHSGAMAIPVSQKRHIRKDSKHYTTGTTHRRRGFFIGGGFKSGK
ncbi:MAG: hypothetical protein ACLFQV_08760 [Vulcanimicrobiota bacterium]